MKRRSSALLYPMGLLALTMALGGCAITRTRIQDATRPRGPSWIADFSAVAGTAGVASNSVVMQKGTTARRILVSPNLVFESSRSSLTEPNTMGPSTLQKESPSLLDALGRPVSIEMSTLLLRYLSGRNKQVVVPAVTRRWSLCNEAAPCLQSTWVERVLVQAQRTRMDQLAAEDRESFPDSMLAVRTLGLYYNEVPLIALRDEAQKTIVIKKRRFEGEKSDCELPPLRTVGVAVEAEVVNIKDGTIIARVDERNIPALPELRNREIPALAYEPEYELAYAKESIDGKPQLDSSYKYITGYRSRDALCDNVRAAYADIGDVVIPTAELERLVSEMLEKAFKPLWVN
jgi:hypothetical protein